MTGLPPHPTLGASVKWLLPHPSWSSPGREFTWERADAHPAGEEDLGKGASEVRGGFHTGLGAAAILTSACLRSQPENHQQHISTLGAQLLEKRLFHALHHYQHHP